MWVKSHELYHRRCFDVLGFDQYLEPYADGLQILRYNMSTAYIPHMDYLDVTDLTEHDFDSALKGGNRYATILLYFTTHGDKAGGETVFTEAWPVGQAEEDRVDVDEVSSFGISNLRRIPGLITCRRFESYGSRVRVQC